MQSSELYNADKTKRPRKSARHPARRAVELYSKNKKLLMLTAAILFLATIFIKKVYLRFVPTWTAIVAEEAEKIANLHCSGHGRAYLDGTVSTKGIHLCECNNCYTGSDCSKLDDEDCVADVYTGDAMFLEKYWLQEKPLSAVLIPGWHRMSYYYNPNTTNFECSELVDLIKRLHTVVGNAKADGKYIVFGNGVTQLLTGLVISLSESQSSSNKTINNTFWDEIKVVSGVPYYPVFRNQTKYFRCNRYVWAGDASKYRLSEPYEHFIEIVTSPNNPDGNLRRPILSGRAVVITDRVYYWPHYTAISHIPADDDIMLFSMSKFTGHAGSRFGWALIKNEEVYKNLLQYMTESSEGTSHDTQLRSLILIKRIVNQLEEKDSHQKSRNIFNYGYGTLKTRWKKLNDLVSSSDRFSLQIVEPKNCTYFRLKNNEREPSPAFGWLKCEWDEDDDCEALLKNGRIKTQGGKDFDASSRYTRLSLIKTDDDFDQMMKKLEPLVKEKKLIPRVNEKKT